MLLTATDVSANSQNSILMLVLTSAINLLFTAGSFGWLYRTFKNSYKGITGGSSYWQNIMESQVKTYKEIGESQDLSSTRGMLATSIENSQLQVMAHDLARRSGKPGTLLPIVIATFAGVLWMVVWVVFAVVKISSGSTLALIVIFAIFIALYLVCLWQVLVASIQKERYSNLIKFYYELLKTNEKPRELHANPKDYRVYFENNLKKDRPSHMKFFQTDFDYAKFSALCSMDSQTLRNSIEPRREQS